MFGRRTLGSMWYLLNMVATATEPEFHTAILGAGPAGLATAACLRRKGVPAKALVVVERNEVPGSSWHTHYERLHLHTVKRYSHLPYRRFPAHYPQYPSRQQVADYLADYAKHFALDSSTRYGHEVHRVVRRGNSWHVDTDLGSVSAANVVCATGYSNEPNRPTWRGEELFEGEILHSKAYRNGARWRGKRVLIVGLGNSGAEIAMDCFEHGAAATFMSVRSPVHVVPRDTFGLLPSQITGMAASRLPPKLADRLLAPVLNRVVGDLSPWGIRRPEVGPAEQVARHGKVPLIDIGTVSLIKQGFIKVVPDIAGFTRTGVSLVDDTAADPSKHLDVDAVVCATGYRPALERLFRDAEASSAWLSRRGYPSHHGTEVPGQRLWFVGFRNPLIGQLNDIRREAMVVADQIVNGQAPTNASLSTP